jgi:hypothetical protein
MYVTILPDAFCFRTRRTARRTRQIHLKFVCDVQYGALYGGLHDGFVRSWKWTLRGRLHGAFFMSDKPFVASVKPFVAETCPPMLHPSASNGLSDIETHMKNAPCNRPLKEPLPIFHLSQLSKSANRFPDWDRRRLRLLMSVFEARGKKTN